jgi:hypothetical protein
MPTIDKKEFDKNGFLLLKNLFSLEEITNLRNDVYKQFDQDKQKGLIYSVPKSEAKYVKGDLLSKVFLKKILLDDRILGAARAVLGNNLVYFGDSTYQIGTGLRGFHRDNVDRIYSKGQDWEGEYSIIRFGIYMQDHSNFSGGLKVKAGSHNNNNNNGKTILLDTQLGDVVFWSLRTLHSGNAVRLKLFPNLPVDIGEKYVPHFLKKEEANERVACFFSFGVEGKHLQRYIDEYMNKSETMKEHLKFSIMDPYAMQELENKGVKLIKPMK